MANANSETRNKKKGKYKDNKKYPYRKGGARRSMNDTKQRENK